MPRYCGNLKCFNTGAPCICSRTFCASCLPAHQAECKALPHGHPLGEVKGVKSYNCHYDEIKGEYDHLNYVRSRRGSLVYTGDKWQCVEFARRWWLEHFDVYLPDVPRACDIWERKFVKRQEDGARVDIQKFANGKSPVAPAVGDMLLWAQSDELPVGHVAVVVEVEERWVRIAEQNALNHVEWAGPWSREFPLVLDQTAGTYTILDEDVLLGWVRLDHSRVLPRIPWKAPDEDRTAVDGDYGAGTVTCLQKFLGIRADGQHGRFTDFALAAFLNTHLQDHPHVPMAALGQEMNRKPLIAKLQAFLLAHPLISGVSEGIEIKETGEMDVPTVKGLQNLLNRVTFADEFKAAAAIYKAGGGPPPRPNLPHGVLLSSPKYLVAAYNCNYQNMQPPAEGEVFDMLNYVRDSRGNLQFSGMKWQCVEYARRWWLSQFDVTLQNVPRACDIWRRKSVKRLKDGREVALRMFPTGLATEPPAVGDLIIWVKTDEQPVGHVAVVCEVSDTFVRIAEQNVNNNIVWEGGFSREFPLQKDSVTGAYTLRDDEDPLFGWVRVFPDQVVETPPWTPVKPHLPVDGVLSPETITAWQMFVGIDLKRDLGDVDMTQGRWAAMIGRMTDWAAASFLNVAHQAYPHVAMQSFQNHERGPYIKKLQNFLNAHPALSGVGGDLTIAENGEWDEPTTKGVQNLLNKVDHYEEFERAVAYYQKQKQ